MNYALSRSYPLCVCGSVSVPVCVLASHVRILIPHMNKRKRNTHTHYSQYWPNISVCFLFPAEGLTIHSSSLETLICSRLKEYFETSGNALNSPVREQLDQNKDL